ncbi:hypothetical protein PTKIN_Ptkin13bG0003300 [Pterospermum kingtungense]
MSASLKGRYTDDEATAVDTLAVNAGDVKLRALTDAKFVNGPSLNGLTVAVKKPGYFIVDHHAPKKDLRYLFRNTVKFLKHAFTYSYRRGDKRKVVDGTLVFDSANKVSATYVFGSKNCKLKYSYVLGGVTTFEPCYNLGKKVWDFSISRRVYENVFKATYQTRGRNLVLEWLRNSLFNGTFKISASVNLAEESKVPKFITESTWELEM